MMKKNDEFQLEITGMTAEGNGVGKKDGMAVFVANTAIGDTVLAHIIKAKKNYAVARVNEITVPSPDRIEPDCEVFNRCGGCVYRHISYEAELKIKQQRVADSFARIACLPVPLDPIIGSESPNGYRNKAQLPVGEEKGETKIGFYSQRTHNIIDCSHCRLQPEQFGAVADAFREWIKENKISIYSEEKHSGLLRHIYIRSAEGCKEMLVCAVINGNSLPCADSLWARLCALGATGLIINSNKAKTNVVLGETNRLLYGKGTVTDLLCGTVFEISPLSFYQVNRRQAERLYSLAAEYADLDKDTTLLDMYCGAGTIGLTMAKKVKALIGVEIVPDAIKDAEKNAEANGITNARFICGDAASAASQLEKEAVRPDVVVLDPPRKGCDEALINTVAQMNPKRIVYVSCDPATLARDYAIFYRLGYECKKATPVDMFPRTAHVETVAQFVRKNA